MDGTTYTVDLTPNGQEVTITLDVKAGVCADAAGNANAALAGAFSRMYTQRPTVAISSSITKAYKNSSPIAVTITFNKAVENFTNADVTVANCTTGNFATSDNTVWTAELTPAGQGLLLPEIGRGAKRRKGPQRRELHFPQRHDAGAMTRLNADGSLDNHPMRRG